MSKLYRSLLWSGLLVAGVTACGDDVTVAPPPTAGVNSVTVGPTGVTIAVGQTLQMAAAVNADAGIATTVTWATSNAAIASISATGLVTGVASGSVAITACSTVSTGVCGQATVTVASSAPATISIKSITNTVIGTGEVPVNINAVAGQINVALNLDAGTQNVSNVQVLIDGQVACQQGFSAIQEAAARAQAALLLADDATASLVVEIICSINTAAFNATTGVPVYLNGPRLLTARVNLVGSAPVATPSTSLIFANVNFVAVTTTVTGGSSANNATTGILWQTGTLSATALPVIYTAGSPTINQVTLTPSAGGMIAKVLTTAPFTTTWPKGTTFVNGGSGSGSTGAEVFGLTVNANSTVGGAVGPVGVSNAVNLDNKSPGAPTFLGNPNGRRNGWINATVVLTGGSAAVSATTNNWLLNGAADAGVGGYNRFLRIGDGLAGTVAAANAATASAAPALPAPTLTNNTLCAVATATDALGNESTLPTGTTPCLQILTTDPSAFNTTTSHILFGVDILAPTIAFSGGLPALGATAGRILAATVGAEFQVTVADAGAIGVSGMLAGAPVVGTVKIFNATGTTCFVGSGASCTNVSINVAPALPLVPTTTVAASTTDGYYTGVFIAQDAAGNQSASVTRSIVHEVAGNPGVVTNALFNVPLSGSQATFQALASDNLDLRDIQYNLTYGGGLAAPILYPVQNINATPPVPATLLNSNISVGTTINGFMRQVENVTGNAPVTVGGAFKPNNLQAIIRDQVQASAAVNTGILAGQVTTGTSYLAAAAPQLIRSWAITNAATNVSDNAGPAAAVNPLSVTLVADAFGPTATFNAPFTRVDFYALFGGFLVQIGTGTPDITFDDGSAFGRRQRWTFSWTPGTSVGLGAISLFAIGVNASGDALVSPVNANITVTNP
jgi:Big-like domain-containing protein